MSTCKMGRGGHLFDPPPRTRLPSTRTHLDTPPQRGKFISAVRRSLLHPATILSATPITLVAIHSGYLIRAAEPGLHPGCMAREEVPVVAGERQVDKSILGLRMQGDASR